MKKQKDGVVGFEKIHTAIVEYWEAKGCHLEPRIISPNGTLQYVLWDAVRGSSVIKNATMEFTVCAVYWDETPTIYYGPDGKEWGEKEILKIMNNRAFL